MGLGAILAFALMIVAGFGYREASSNERLAVYRLGRLVDVRSSGPTWIIPLIENSVRVDLNLSVPDWESLSPEDLNAKIESWLIENVRA